eukprot:Em0001g2934a
MDNKATVRPYKCLPHLNTHTCPLRRARWSCCAATLTGWLSCGERRMELLGGEGVCAEPLTWNGIAMTTAYC